MANIANEEVETYLQSSSEGLSLTVTRPSGPVSRGLQQQLVPQQPQEEPSLAACRPQLLPLGKSHWL